jgi:hypothetical protein
MSSVVLAGIGGFLGALIGKSATVFDSGGRVVGRVQIEPWDFIGVSVFRINALDQVKQLNISGAVKSILIRADPRNSGIVWLGGSDVSVGNGYPLFGDSILAMQVRNFDDIFVVTDATVDQIIYVVKLGEKI